LIRFRSDRSDGQDGLACRGPKCMSLVVDPFARCHAAGKSTNKKVHLQTEDGPFVETGL